MRTLADVNADYEALPSLDHLRHHASFVPGEGPIGAPITVLGEAPGEEENRQKRPFVGVSGQWLMNELTGIGLHRAYLYITNVVKYRPPGNRTPLHFEMLDSEPLLREEIDIVGSALIIACGRIALNMFRLGSVHELHGQLFRLDDSPRMVLPLFHPSACLRDLDLASMTHADIQKIKELLA